MPARSLVLPAASLCAGVLATLVYVHNFDLVLLREHVYPPLALGALPSLLMASAAAGLRWTWLRVVIVVLTVLGASATLFVASLAFVFSSVGRVGYADGPGPYRIRLQQTMGGLGANTGMSLSLRRDDGLLSRVWDLGCFDDDDPDDTFDSVRWTGPSSLEIRVADGRTFPMALRPGSGRPEAIVALNC